MNLRDLIREALDATTAPTVPADVARAIADQIPAKERQDALTEALSHMVRDVIVQARPATPAPGAPGKSWKRDAIRQAEQVRRSELDARYATAEGYKALRHFNYDELLVLADRCQRLAEANAAQAERFHRIADAMQAANVSTVEDLDTAALAGLGVAA